MIYFNTNDVKIIEIKETSKLRNALTREDFRIYGLKQQDNPPVFIEFSENSDTRALLQDKCGKLIAFFQRNGIKVECETFQDAEDEGGDTIIDYKIYVGLRRDVRANKLLSAAILQTIIYFIDGKIELDPEQTIPGIPKFVS